VFEGPDFSLKRLIIVAISIATNKVATTSPNPTSGKSLIANFGSDLAISTKERTFSLMCPTGSFFRKDLISSRRETSGISLSLASAADSMGIFRSKVSACKARASSSE
jgi:hypothetical protein